MPRAPKTEPIVQPSADWEELTKETYEKLENSTDRWNVVFHDASPRFQVLNELAAWAKTEIKGACCVCRVQAMVGGVVRVFFFRCVVKQ